MWNLETMPDELHSPKLVNAQELLELLFSENSRPSRRWLRNQMRRRAIPHVKIGRLVRFDPEAVRRALEKMTVTTR